MRFSVKQIAMIAASAALSFTAVSSLASGFQLYEQSGAQTGDYHSGYAAEADDASTEFYNPAGMTRLKHPEVSAGGVLIPLSVAFNGDIIEHINPLPPITNNTGGWQNGDTTNFVPNFHAVYPFSDRWAAGFGVTVPFGLATSYPWTNNVALGATVTRLQAININPNIAFAITKQLSVAAGVDYVYGTATYDSVVGIVNNFADVTAQFNNSLSDTAWGWNAGMLFQFNSRNRIGLSYRSHILLKATGTSTVSNNPALASFIPGNSTDNLNAELDLPGYATLSMFSNVAKKWDVMGTAMWVNWNRFNTLALNNTALPASLNLENLIIQENYRNTWNFAVGAHYHISQRIMLKMGGGFDFTPTKYGYRDYRLPDQNRIAAALGIQAKVTKSITANFGWAHFFSGRVPVNSERSGNPVSVTGSARLNADVLGFQVSAELDTL
ncbi:MAG: OmpP1/FadL family transporter [Coxiellaceae bacterium]|nr:OmpP1/FadL family transporter [Coxiellaceae bacterium]